MGCILALILLGLGGAIGSFVGTALSHEGSDLDQMFAMGGMLAGFVVFFIAWSFLKEDN